MSSDGAMIEAHNQIRVNLQLVRSSFRPADTLSPGLAEADLSAVRFLRSFAAIPYQYED